MPKRGEQDRASAPKMLRVTRGARQTLKKKHKLLLYHWAIAVITEGAGREESRAGPTLLGSGEGFPREGDD